MAEELLMSDSIIKVRSARSFVVLVLIFSAILKVVYPFAIFVFFFYTLCLWITIVLFFF